VRFCSLEYEREAKNPDAFSIKNSINHKQFIDRTAAFYEERLGSEIRPDQRVGILSFEECV